MRSRRETKLREAVTTLVADPSEAEWVLSHLRPLLGLPGATAEQSERFAAWRRFFEALGEVRPAVLVFEDLHWADDGLLDFVDYLADWAVTVPLLIVCTARPELLDRRPGWGGGKRNATSVALSPLSDDDVGRLIAALLERSVLPAETKSELLRRADGNPLYAEEYVRAAARGTSSGRDAARERAGNHRRAPRHAARLRTSPCSRTRRSSARSSGSAQSPLSAACRAPARSNSCIHSSAGSSSAARGAAR